MFLSLSDNFLTILQTHYITLRKLKTTTIMYERKIPIDFECGINVAMEVIFSKWKSCILLEISKGTVRPKDLVEAIPGLTKRVLHQQLKQLEFYEVINHITYPETPPRVEYSLTETGESALSILTDVEKWGLGFTPEFKRIVESNNTHKSEIIQQT